MIKYKTTGLNWPIEAVKIVRESEKSVWYENILGSGCVRLDQERKVSDYHQYHDTWQDAKDYLLGRARQKVESARARLVDAEDTLSKIEALRQYK